MARSLFEVLTVLVLVDCRRGTRATGLTRLSTGNRRVLTQQKVSEKCFRDCINEFRNKTLSDDERKCAQVCFQVGACSHWGCHSFRRDRRRS